MTNFEKVGLFMKTFGQEIKNNAGFSSEKINSLIIGKRQIRNSEMIISKYKITHNELIFS